MDIPATIGVDKRNQNIFEAVRTLTPEELRERAAAQPNSEVARYKDDIFFFHSS